MRLISSRYTCIRSKKRFVVNQIDQNSAQHILCNSAVIQLSTRSPYYARFLFNRVPSSERLLSFLYSFYIFHRAVSRSLHVDNRVDKTSPWIMPHKSFRTLRLSPRVSTREARNPHCRPKYDPTGTCLSCRIHKCT